MPLSDNELKGLLSGVIEAKGYDTDLACQTMELVRNLKTKVKEDFDAIDTIREKLSGIEKVQFILDDLGNIKSNLQETETKIDELLTKLTPKD